MAITHHTLDDIQVSLDHDFIALVTPRVAMDLDDLNALLESRRDFFQDLMARRGVVLFRGFITGTPEQLHALVSRGLGQSPWNAFNFAALPGFVASLLRKYIERLLGAGDYRRYLNKDTVRLGPTENAIQGPHVEAGSTLVRPRHLALFCQEPAPFLGETGVVDLHRVFSELPLALQEKYSRAWNRYSYTTSRRVGWWDRLILSMSPFTLIERPDGRALLALPPTPAVCTVPGSADRALQPWAFARNTNGAVFEASVAAFPGRGELQPDSTAETMDLFWDLCDEQGNTIEWTPEEQRMLFDRIFARAHLLVWQKGDIALVDNVRMGHWRMNGEQGNRKLLQIQVGSFEALRHRPGLATPAGAAAQPA